METDFENNKKAFMVQSLFLKDGEPVASHSPNWIDNPARWPKELKEQILKWRGMAMVNGAVTALYHCTFMTFEAVDRGLDRNFLPGHSFSYTDWHRISQRAKARDW